MIIISIKVKEWRTMMEIDARFEFVGGVLNRLWSELTGAKKARNLQHSA
jgi:hypothetical protein